MSERGLMMWRLGSCCSSGEEITQVELDGMTIGLVGLKQVFRQLYTLGRRPSDPIGDKLLAMVKARNYVPRSAEEVYKAALLREYVAFCTQNK